MKKCIKYFLCFIFLLLLFMLKDVRASTGSTVFIGEPIVLDNYEDVEITLNEVDINEETSEVKNMHLFTNLSDTTITRKASIKLEDSFSKFTINSLKIVVNGYEIKEISKEGDNYNFSFQIPPNEGKKIEITYKTDNDLQNAKIIKYTMDSIKGKEVKLYKINVKLSKYDIPLVQKIWPGAYEFENNTVSGEYFDFKVNNLTSTFVIQKETYKNLKYGENADSYSEEDRYIISHAINIIEDGVDVEFSKYNNGEVDKVLDKSGYLLQEGCGGTIHSAPSSIVQYVLGKELDKDNRQIYEDTSGYEYSNLADINGFCLTNRVLREIDKNMKEMFVEGDRLNSAKGKNVAINYYETEGDKTLYMYKNLDNSAHSIESNNGYVIRKEWDILRVCKDDIAVLYGYNPIYVNSDIDGNKIDITEEEIIDFVNMMNVDMYLRIVIYDKRNENDYVEAGYYTDDALEIALKYLDVEKYINTYKNEIEEIKRKVEKERNSYYVNGELSTFEEWKKDHIEWYNKRIENEENRYRKFSNEVVANNSKVPTIAECIAKLDEENGLYYIRSASSIYGNIYSASECDVAKNMLASNKANNDATKNSIINKITNTKITTDFEEYKNKIENAIKVENIANVENNNTNIENDSKIKTLVENNKMYIIIALATLIIFILLISLIKTRKIKK